MFLVVLSADPAFFVLSFCRPLVRHHLNLGRGYSSVAMFVRAGLLLLLLLHALPNPPVYVAAGVEQLEPSRRLDVSSDVDEINTAADWGFRLAVDRMKVACTIYQTTLAVSTCLDCTIIDILHKKSLRTDSKKSSASSFSQLPFGCDLIGVNTFV